MSPTTSHWLPRADLAASTREEMHDLLCHHFTGVTREQFEADLHEKNWVILLHRDGRLVGFSTLLVYETLFENEILSVVCSGDTIVAPEAWNSPTLSKAWIACVNELRASYPRGKYYWLLLTSGFRTYRFLPVFWREFHPRCDAHMPSTSKRMLDFLARQRYGAQYDFTAGIVRFTHPQRLRDDLCAVPEGKSTDPHVDFFLKQNPGHGHGDELVCLTELTGENLTPAGRRMVRAPANECQYR